MIKSFEKDKQNKIKNKWNVVSRQNEDVTGSALFYSNPLYCQIGSVALRNRNVNSNICFLFVFLQNNFKLF